MRTLWISAISLVLASAVGMSACGEIAEPDDERELLVAAGPLTSATTIVYFAVSGDGIADGTIPYIGTRGTMPAGTPRTSTATFLIPEGYKDIQAWGLDTFQHSALTGRNVTFYELRDQCGAQFTLQSRSQRSVSVPCTDLGAGTGNVGLDKVILSGDYEFDANAQYAGSLDGSNIARFIIDGAAANQPVAIGAGRDWGCFKTLPTIWPPVADWTGCVGTNTDANGDWLGYIVATPGSSGAGTVNSMEIGVTPSEDVRYWMLRVAGLGRIIAVAE